jgi:hypothetical protein
MFATGLQGPLPDMLPGAFPCLKSLVLSGNTLRSTLPASWGSRPDTLPALEVLELSFQVEAPLPAAWAAGFGALKHLKIEGGPAGLSTLPPPLPAPAAMAAPEEWGLPGAFPSLVELSLLRLPLAGTLPASWVDGGFPSLQEL